RSAGRVAPLATDEQALRGGVEDGLLTGCIHTCNLRPPVCHYTLRARNSMGDHDMRRATVADVIELLEHDHREVEQMFAEFEQATSKEQKETLRDRIIIELVRHSEAEEQAVYPMIRKAIDNGDQIVEHEIDEHSKAERIMKELDTMSADDPQFGVLMQQLMASIKEHVAEEENDVFPQ